MKELFKNKLFIILSLFLILVIFISSSCFASSDVTVNISHTDYTFTLNDDLLSYNYCYFAIYEKNDSYGAIYYTYIMTDYEMYYGEMSFNYGQVIKSTLMFTDGLEHEYKAFTLSSYTSEIDNAINRFNNLTINDFNSFTLSFVNQSAIPSDNTVFVFSKTTLLDENDNVVFQVAPQAQGEVVQVELMKPTQVQEISQQIVAVVMIVLPIFLGIFGVLLVLYLIKSKNLLQL